MPNFGMLPFPGTLLGLATVTTTGSSANLTLPPASSYRLFIQVQTVSGTTPTLVAILSTSCDNGATYNEFISSTTATTTGSGSQLLIRPYLGIGDAATSQASTVLGQADLAASVINNGPIVPGFIKVRWVLSGTTPSFAWQIQYIAVPQDMSD